MRIATGDLEANGLLDTATKVHCGVFKESTGLIVKFRPHQIKEMLAYMDTIDVLKMHNGLGYDWPLLKKLYGYEYKGKKVDTLIMSRLLNPKRLVPFNCPNKTAGPHSVEAWGWRVGRGKPEHNDWENFSEGMLHRCTEDVEIQELIFEELMKEAKGGDWKQAFLLSFKLFENLQKQEEYGWLVDQDHMHRCISQLTHWIRKIDIAVTPYIPKVLVVNELKKAGEYGYVKKPFLKSGAYSEGVNRWILDSGLDSSSSPVLGVFSRIDFRPTNLDSGEETKDFLLGMGWEPKDWNTNDAGERTSPKLSKDDPFEGIEGKLGRLVAKRVQCRHRRSTIEGLFKVIRSDGRIPSVVNTLAVTGRATHRNIVNIPKAGSFYGNQMRAIFIAAEGKVLVGTDSDSCQLRMLAGRMKNDKYTEALVNGDKKLGTDSHTLTAKAADLESRDIAKNVMYCLLFGGQDKKLGNTAKKPGRGAEVRKALYHGLDGLQQLVEGLVKEWRATARQKYNPRFNKMEYFNGKITGLDGRPITVPSEHALLVYLLQSDEAIMMQAAYNKCHKMLQARGYVYGDDYGFVCWYHDEYTIECREEIAKDVAYCSEQAIAWAGNFFKIPCPHLGHAAIGKSWYAIH